MVGEVYLVLETWRAGEKHQLICGCGVEWLVGTRKTRVRVQTGRGLRVMCWLPHLSPLLQVAIKVIPRNRVLGWSPWVSIFAVLFDLATPSLTMDFAFLWFV